MPNQRIILEYPMAGDGCQAPGTIVLVYVGESYLHPYVVWFRNDADTRRLGYPAYSSGDYCQNLPNAAIAFGNKCKRYDPTGELHKELQDA